LSWLLLALGTTLITWPGRARSGSEAQSDGTRAVAIALVAGLILIELALLVAGIPALLRLFGENRVCDHVVLAPLPDHLGASTTALVLAVLLPISAWRVVRRARRLRAAATVEPWIGVHRATAHADLVVVPTEELLAVGVPGSRPQVVLSEGLVDALAPRSLEAIIEHEVAHHTLRHDRYLLLAAIVDGTIGRMGIGGRSTAILRERVEYWADDEAARRTGRSNVRHALVEVAAVHRSRGSRDALRVATRCRRLRAGAAAPVRFGLARASVATVATVLVASFAVFSSIGPAHHVLEIGGHCLT
jgi:hypothetical protein